MKTFVTLGIVGLLVCFAPARAQQPAATTSAAPQPAKPYRVVDLKNGSFVINEPGNYVLNRSWSFRSGVAEIIIDVVAADVVLDFRGFEIEVAGVTGIPQVTVVNVRGGNFTLQNAVIDICCDGGTAVRSTGTSTLIERLSGFSFQPITLEGDRSVIRDSSLNARSGVTLASRSTIENTAIICRAGCVTFTGDENRLLNSRIQPADFLAIRIGGNDNVLAGNFIDWLGGGPEVETVFDVRGDSNVVRDNTLAAAGDTGVVVKVAGTGNVIDGNIADLAGDFARISTGIRFEQDGNFYGDNRMDASVPFDAGATVQTDWGGNVGY